MNELLISTAVSASRNRIHVATCESSIVGHVTTISIANEQMSARVIEDLRLMVGGHEGCDLSGIDLSQFDAREKRPLGPGLTPGLILE